MGNLLIIDVTKGNFTMNTKIKILPILIMRLLTFNSFTYYIYSINLKRNVTGVFNNIELFS